MLKFELPEGFTAHDGKSCPLPEVERQHTVVAVYFPDSVKVEDVCDGETAAFWDGADESWWIWDECKDYEDRIVAWKVIEVIKPVIN